MPKAKEKKPKAGAKLAWPKALAQQVQAVRAALVGAGRPQKAAELAKRFKSAPKKRVHELLSAMAALGQARAIDAERFAA